MNEGLHAAFTAVDITPDQERLSSNGKKKDRSYPVYDPLKARILLLQDAEHTAAIVAVDGFELGIDFDEKVADALEARGIAPFPTLFCPSHIGSTPISNYGAYIMIFAQDLIIENYEDEISARIAEGIQDAFDKLVPVRMSSRGGHAPEVCYNRRFIKPDGTVHMVFNRQESPPDPAWIEQGKDDEVSVLRFDTLDGESIGAFINFGCHALCSTDKYGGISADYPRYVADVFGEVAGLPIVFAQGGLGDVVPIEREGWAARRIGRSVGAQALYVFEQIKPDSTPTMETHFREVDIPARVMPEEPEEMRFNFKRMHDRYHRFLYEWYEQNPTIRYPIKVVTLGDTALVHMPGELFHETALAIKEASPFRHTVVISRPTREVAYVPTPEAFDQGGMEPNLAAIAPSSEPLIRQAAIDTLMGLREPVAV